MGPKATSSRSRNAVFRRPAAAQAGGPWLALPPRLVEKPRRAWAQGLVFLPIGGHGSPALGQDQRAQQEHRQARRGGQAHALTGPVGRGHHQAQDAHLHEDQVEQQDDGFQGLPREKTVPPGSAAGDGLEYSAPVLGPVGGFTGPSGGPPGS